MLQPGTIFKGVTPKPFRDYLTYLFKEIGEDYPCLYIPCVGRFTIAIIAVECGYKPENIYTSDISLFSSIIGYVITNNNLDNLGVKIIEEKYKWLEEKYFGTKNYAGALMYLMKITQFNNSNYYENLFLLEMLNQPDKYIKQLQEGVNEFANRLTGINYCIKDMWDEIKENKNYEKNFLFINPPGYSKGYSKMFDEKGIYKWNEIKADEFEPKTDHDKMYDMLLDEKCFAIMYRYKAIEDKLKNNAIFASEYSAVRYDYLLCNKPKKCKKWFKPRNRIEPKRSKYPTLKKEHIITENSTIYFAKSTENEAMYYRDLFAHRLGATKSEMYFLVLIDGYIFSVCGIHCQSLFLDNAGFIHETFGFSVPDENYPYLNKLFMKCLVSSQFKTKLINELNLGIRELKGVKTTCLCQYPELKINRGIMKLTNKEKLKNGMYKLEYWSDFENTTYKDCLKWFLKKEKARKQREEKNNG